MAEFGGKYNGGVWRKKVISKKIRGYKAVDERGGIRYSFAR